MNNDWNYALYFCYLFFFMAIAKLIKEKTGLFRSIIVPTALMAGFIGLLSGPDVLALIDYDQQFFSSIVYHFMGIGFIGLTLASSNEKQGRDSVNSGLFIVSSYVFQGIVGMSILLIGMITTTPSVFPGLGLILPLAYGQGPGFASSIGGSWDEVLTLGYIQQYGLTLATSGFLTGGIVGIVLLNYYVKKYNLPVNRLKHLKGLENKSITFTNVTEINFFDTLTVQVALIAIVYLITYNVMKYTIDLLGYLGDVGTTIASLVKGFNFLFGIMMALLVKKMMGILDKKNHRASALIDNFTMQNVTSFSFNIMITASVMAISISAIKDYWQLLLIMSISGAIATLWFVTYIGRKVFRQHTENYILAMFGMMTGTASTGLALLRGVDPNLETDVAKNLVLGSALATPMALPLMALLAIPILGYTDQRPLLYWLTFAALILYLAIVLSIALYRNRTKTDQH